MKWSGEQQLLSDHERVNLSGVDLAFANLSGACLVSADLSGADLRGVDLPSVDLQSSNLAGTYLRVADLSGADLGGAILKGADLRECRLNVTTQLAEGMLDSATRLADVVWNDAPLTRVAWETAPTLGDEAEARRRKDKDGRRKHRVMRPQEYATAARAYRQLAVALRGQGMNDDADRYGYRAQLMQRKVLRFRRRWGSAFGSWLLDVVAGYGYRPLRSLATYLLVVAVFGLAYWTLGVQTGHMLTWNEAGVVSLTAFHGRGFFATAFQPSDPQAAIAAIEAVIGLLIEITFIATFTNRFFAR